MRADSVRPGGANADEKSRRSGRGNDIGPRGPDHPVVAQSRLARFPADAPAAYRLSLDAGHPWRPPFRLDRVGQPIAAIVEANTTTWRRDLSRRGFLRAESLSAVRSCIFPRSPPSTARVTLAGVFAADELVLSATAANRPKPVELARQTIRLPEIEADAVAIADRIVNPVDLGTILVPAGWLLLGPGQTATLEIAALCRTRDLSGSRFQAWFNSVPVGVAASPISPPRLARRND